MRCGGLSGRLGTGDAARLAASHCCSAPCIRYTHTTEHAEMWIPMGLACSHTSVHTGSRARLLGSSACNTAKQDSQRATNKPRTRYRSDSAHGRPNAPHMSHFHPVEVWRAGVPLACGSPTAHCHMCGTPCQQLQTGQVYWPSLMLGLPLGCAVLSGRAKEWEVKNPCGCMGRPPAPHVGRSCPPLGHSYLPLDRSYPPLGP